METLQDAPQTTIDDAEVVHAELLAVLRPYQSEWRRREKISKFLDQCLRASQRDDFFQLAELLGQKEAQAAAADPELPGTAEVLQRLRARTEARIDSYRVQFLSDLATLAAEAELPLEIDFPHLRSRKGITGTIDFAGRKTTLNGEVLKSVDPKRIVAQLQRLERRLYGRSFDPQAFIDGLFQTYKSMIDAEKGSIGQPVPVRDFYFKYVLSLQTGSFFQDSDKRKFRGYPLDEFSVDLWRFFESEVHRTSGGHVLSLRPGRNQSLWLLDRDGERRQITNLSFQDTP
jgi:hypothetical protein